MPLARLVPLLLVAALSACAGGAGAPEPTPAETPGGEREVTFTTEDGITLHGRLFGRGRVGVVLAHMFPTDAESWYPAAQRLAEEGYATLAFNFRGYSPSEGSREVGTADVDVRAAYTYLLGTGADQVVLVGASMGGSAALVVAAELEVPAVVALSAPTRFRGLDAWSVADLVSEPVLLLAASGDGPGHESVLMLSERLPNATLRVFGGDAHGTNLLTDRPESLEEIVAFLGEHAPAETP